MSGDTTRRGFLTAAGTGAAAAIAGCSSSSEDTTESTTSDDGGDGTQTTSGGGTLEMMATGSIQTLDPINAKGSGAGYNQYGAPLMQFPDGLYPPEAALVEDYSISEDGLTYTFDLKQDLTFHDGQELTAQDVVYTYRRIAESPNSRNKDDIIGDTMTIEHEKDASIASPEDEETLDDIVPQSLAVRAPDDYTFEFDLASTFEYTLFQIAGGNWAILPENAVGDIEGYDGEYEYNEFFSTSNGGPKYAGLGAFQVDSWTKGSEITLSAFEDYWNGEPELDEIRFTVVTSGNTRVNRFTGENAHILEGMPTSSFNPNNVSIDETKGSREIGTYTFGDGTEVNYGQIPALTTEYLVFNTLEVPLPVRKAFAYALNQHDVAENVYKGTATPAYHITPPDPYPTFEDGVTSRETYTRHAEDGYQSNTQYGENGYPYGYGETMLGEAQRVMEDADYGENNRFSVTATTISGNDAYTQILTTLQAKLRTAHIDMEITEANFGTIISQAINGSMEVFALGDGMEYPGPQNFLRFLHGKNPSGQFTRWGAEGSYYNEEVRQLARDAWDENYAADDATAESKAEAFQTIEEVNWASVQELPTVNPISQRFWHQNVDVDMYGVMENQTFDDVTIQ
ncbi:ABC transporter substrate-binding protein [Salarchaeum sp. III]|uniref:ABC transporter substrate-binding protein n=1 Tax=Salarchaeum sp. III TaxID=3107927 RepID=UPI002ED79162